MPVRRKGVRALCYGRATNRTDMKGAGMNVWGLIFLAFAAVCAVFIAARVARKGPESGLPRCSTCSLYTGCPCDRPKTKSPDEQPEENEDA